MQTAPSDWHPRLAVEADVPALEAIIPVSVRALQTAHYSDAQIEAALATVYGVDRQLIRDGTYYVVERESRIVGCGGWSRRRSMYGGDRFRIEPDAELDPMRDAARLRAFYVEPACARSGIGRAIVLECERAMRAGGFARVEVVATLPGEPLYAAFGYAALDRFEIAMKDGLGLPVVRMTKTLAD